MEVGGFRLIEFLVHRWLTTSSCHISPLQSQAETHCVQEADYEDRFEGTDPCFLAPRLACGAVDAARTTRTRHRPRVADHRERPGVRQIARRVAANERSRECLPRDRFVGAMEHGNLVSNASRASNLARGWSNPSPDSPQPFARCRETTQPAWRGLYGGSWLRGLA